MAEYTVDGNATQAAIRAGYSAKTAKQIGSALLTNLDVSAAVERARGKAIAKVGITRTKVLTELEALAHSRVDNYLIDAAGNVTVKEGVPDSAMGAIKSIERKEWSDGSGEGHNVEVKLTFWDKPGMLRLAGKYKSIRGFVDRVEHTGKNGKDLIPSMADALEALLSAAPKKA